MWPPAPLSKWPLWLRVLVLELDLDLLSLQAHWAGLEAGKAAEGSPSPAQPTASPGRSWAQGAGSPGWEVKANVARGEASRAPGCLGDPGWATAGSPSSFPPCAPPNQDPLSVNPDSCSPFFSSSFLISPLFVFFLRPLHCFVSLSFPSFTFLPSFPPFLFLPCFFYFLLPCFLPFPFTF